MNRPFAPPAPAPLALAPPALSPCALATLALVAAATVVLGGPRPAHAQQWPTTDPRFVPASEAGGPAERFGERGQVALSSAFDLDFEYRLTSLPGPTGKTTSSTRVTVAPALDIFMAKNLAVGGLLRLSHASSDTLKSTAASVAPTVAYNILVSRRLTFFPKVGVGFTYTSITTILPQLGQTTSTGWSLGALVSLPLLFHPVPNFFVGLGPFASRDFIARVENAAKKEVDGPIATTLGLALDVGGYF
jgi:hypothetical protein